MNKLLSAAEIAALDLPGLPSTKKAILTRADKEEWYYETKVGLGGVRKLFRIPEAYLPDYQPKTPSEPLKINQNRVEVAGAIAAGEQVNTARLASAIRALDEFLAENQLVIDDPDRKAEIVTFLYKYLEKKANEGDVKDLLRLVTG